MHPQLVPRSLTIAEKAETFETTATEKKYHFFPTNQRLSTFKNLIFSQYLYASLELKISNRSLQKNIYSSLN